MTELKKILKERPACGLLVKVSDSLAHVMIASQSPLDFLFYDLEHGVMNDARLLELYTMGNACGIPSVVRVPQLSRKDISRTLDSGACGIMVPMVESPEQAREMVRYGLYPPQGARSYSGGANTMFGPGGNHARHMAEANEHTLLLAQIETEEGVRRVREILDVDGIDGIVIGPCDLGISMNNPDNVYDDREVDQIRQAQKAARECGKLFGLIGPIRLMEQLDWPVDLVVEAIDTNLMRQSMQDAADRFHAYLRKSGQKEGSA